MHVKHYKKIHICHVEFLAGTSKISQQKYFSRGVGFLGGGWICVMVDTLPGNNYVIAGGRQAQRKLITCSGTVA
jgi:hypothetical protein